MSVYDEVINGFRNLDNFVLDCLDEFNAEVEKGILWIDSVQKDIKEFQKTGVLPQSIREIPQDEPQTQPLAKKDVSRTDNEQIHVTSSSLSSSKENEVSTSQTSNSINKRITRQTKNLVLSNVQKQHDNLINKLSNVQIKIERRSDDVKNDGLQVISDIKIKEEMPPPKLSLLRSRRNKKGIDSAFKIKSEVLDEFVKNNAHSHATRDSDVQIQKDSLPIIFLQDSILEDAPIPIRNTRARTKARKKDVESIEERQNEIEGKKIGVARTKRNKAKDIKVGEILTQNPMNKPKDKGDNEDLNKSRRTRSKNINNEPIQSEENEEPPRKKRNIREGFTDLKASESKQICNETIVISKPVLLNETVVLEKATLRKEITTLNDIMTDDESVVTDSPSKTKHQKKVKQMFSPYENNPVRKRVEAFEKLGATLQITSKVTKPIDKEITKTLSGQKPRFGTPLMKSRLRCLQTSSASKFATNKSMACYNSSLTASKLGNGSKPSASQMELREKELKRKRKESDALQKKEAMILALTEEKRKKREEREMRVQQLKIAKERNKQKQIELTEKAKDEKYKQILAEKEAKLLKQKAEVAKKRAAAAKKVAEAKNNENAKLSKCIPPYVRYETPLLPGPNCYDSDDDSSDHTIWVPRWQESHRLNRIQKAMLHCASHRKKFFLSGHRMPDLKEIFPTISASKLKRTSSAIWNKTEMSILENMTEEYEDW